MTIKEIASYAVVFGVLIAFLNYCKVPPLYGIGIIIILIIALLVWYGFIPLKIGVGIAIINLLFTFLYKKNFPKKEEEKKPNQPSLEPTQEAKIPSPPNTNTLTSTNRKQAIKNMLDEYDKNYFIFDILSYEKRYEAFYLKRDIDRWICRTLSRKSLWISGNYGVGKTVAIQHYFQQKSIKPRVIDLANAGNTVDGLFESILSKLNDTNIPTNPHQTSHAILRGINQIAGEQDMMIFLDEVPIEKPAIFEEFNKKLIGLINAYNNNWNYKKVKFVISTRQNPTAHILPSQSKLRVSFDFLEIPVWTDEQLGNLLDNIANTLALNPLLTPEKRQAMIGDAEKNPRGLKREIQTFVEELEEEFEN